MPCKAWHVTLSRAGKFAAQGVRCVVHYQISASADVYVHRCGRTARAEQDGLAVALVTPREAPRFTALLRVGSFGLVENATMSW